MSDLEDLEVGGVFADEEPEEPEEGEAPEPEAEEEEEGELPEEAEEARPAVTLRVDPWTREATTPGVEHVIRGEERRMRNVLSKSEAGYIVSVRATQISASGKAFVDTGSIKVPTEMATEIATRELLAGRCPLLIRRPVRPAVDGHLWVEEWDPKEMVLPENLN